MTHQPGDRIEWWDDTTGKWRSGVLRSVTAHYRVTGDQDPVTDLAGWSVTTTEIRSSERPVATTPTDPDRAEKW
jgi:hypothetical protein